MVNDAERVRFSNFQHFKTSMGCSMNGMVGYCIISLYMNVRLQFKDRRVLSYAYNCGLYHLLCDLKLIELLITALVCHEFKCHC